mmetsp:Transcript_136762/g.354661  ORF Transcript_136762/g.354661 Transcript_136762/m.354661 type:complete len:641 (-) Transcript_136762:200-2122(-)
MPFVSLLPRKLLLLTCSCFALPGGPRGALALDALGKHFSQYSQHEFSSVEHRGANNVSLDNHLNTSRGRPAMLRGSQEEFIVDNSQLEARSPGLAYRSSPTLADKSGGVYATWGSKVLGTRRDDGWVETAVGFLPTTINGKSVLVSRSAAHGGIIREQGGRTWWGFPSYTKYLDTGLESWEELTRLHGHFGNMCTAETMLDKCGTSLVCKDGVCGECTVSRDCNEKFRCQYFPTSGRHMCVRRDLSEQWSWREGVCTVLIIITAMLSAAAGMGGGGVYVPLLLLLLDFSTKEAVPLSQAMIVGGATVNIIMFCGERHPKYQRKPKIDYDVVMMLNPGLAAGVTLGVMLNVITPQWIIVLVLILTLVLALQKSLTKGLQQFKRESKALAEQSVQGGGGASTQQTKAAEVKIRLADLGSFASLAQDNARPLTLIVGCWLVFLGANVFKAPQCSTMYWLQLVGLVAICVAFTTAGAQTLRIQGGGGVDSAEGMLAWTPETLWLYPLLSTAAGFLGGFLGIGGGIIMGPLLLELGMVAEASQATTAMFVFLSSSLATIQFMFLGRAMPEYALWFTAWVLVATFVGQTLVDYVLQRWKRSSLIVLSIAGIIGGSLVMMTAVGAKDIIHDIIRGADMGFSPMNLCK